MRVRQSLLLVMILIVAFSSGCARYARSVSTIYTPVSTIRGGSGPLHIVMPADQRTQAGNVKWVIGTVKDEEDNKIDEVLSAQSPGELIQNALGQEMAKAGYTVQTATVSPAGSAKTFVITTPELVLDQTSSAGKLTASCRLRMPLEIWRNGQIIKKMEYTATYSDTSVTDRDILAKTVLQETFNSTMRKAVPELIAILESGK